MKLDWRTDPAFLRDRADGGLFLIITWIAEIVPGCSNPWTVLLYPTRSSPIYFCTLVMIFHRSHRHCADIMKAAALLRPSLCGRFDHLAIGHVM
jgi:hypothetical protein